MFFYNIRTLLLELPRSLGPSFWSLMAMFLLPTLKINSELKNTYLDSAQFLSKSFDLLPHLNNVLLSDFVEEKSFPELIIVVEVVIVWCCFRRSEREMLANEGTIVAFKALDAFEYLRL